MFSRIDRHTTPDDEGGGRSSRRRTHATNVMMIPKRNDDMVWLKCRENSTEIIYIYIFL